MHREVVDGLLVDQNSLQVDKRVSVKNANGAISRGREKVAREREGRRGEEGDRGDGGGVLVEGSEGGSRREVIEVYCVVSRARSGGGAGGGGGGDVSEVRLIGEKWG